MLISEVFYSLQGEGELTGVPSVFVRTSGCNLRCAWCDTPYAVEHATWRKKHEATRWQPEVVRAWIDAYNYQFKFVVSSPGDIEELEHMLAALHREIPRHKILLMPEATTLDKMRTRATWL